MMRIKAPSTASMPGTMHASTQASRTPPLKMRAAGKTYDPVTYDGAGHGFMRAGEAPDAKDADKKARADAWVRWKSLLGK